MQVRNCKRTHTLMSPALDYTDNEVSLTVTNTNQAPMTLEAGTRFAQMVLAKTYRPKIKCYITLPLLSTDQQTSGDSGSAGGVALSTEIVDCDCRENKLM